LIKYIKSVLSRVAKRLSYIEDARCLKVKTTSTHRSRRCLAEFVGLWGQGIDFSSF